MRYHVRNQATGLLVLRNVTAEQVAAYYGAHQSDDLVTLPASRR